jgi:hypothetical protein
MLTVSTVKLKNDMIYFVKISLAIFDRIRIRLLDLVPDIYKFSTKFILEIESSKLCTGIIKTPS